MAPDHAVCSGAVRGTLLTAEDVGAGLIVMVSHALLQSSVRSLLFERVGL
jgi:hypothetical protein